MSERRLRPLWWYVGWYVGLSGAMLAVAYVAR